MNLETTADLLRQLARRCTTAKLTFNDESDLDMEHIDFTIEIPCGRETRTVFLFDPEDLEAIAATNFESYRFLGNYAAVVDYGAGIIEAILSLPSEPRSPIRRMQCLRRIGVAKADRSLSSLALKPPRSDASVIIKIRPVSEVAKILSQSPDPLGVSLEISGLSIAEHDEAVVVLERIANALLFDIDLQKGIHFALLRKSTARRRVKLVDTDVALQFPRNEYEAAPMALYWYARSATSMPLLQFLAFYQVIEFYYPVYFNAEVGRRIRSIIKNPSFRLDSDIDVTRIVATIRSKGQGAGSEKEQLKATMKECVPNADLDEFLASDLSRSDFFASKAKGITSCVLNKKNVNMEMYSQVAERIYDIRCKIVHIKGDQDDSELELLLPYSKEAERLDHDIDLVRFVAQKVLIAASKQLNIGSI